MSQKSAERLLKIVQPLPEMERQQLALGGDVDHIDDYLAWVRASGASPHTVRLRRHFVSQLAACHPDQDILCLTASELADFLGMRPEWMPETRRAARSSVRRFYQWALDSELIAADPSRKLPAVRVPRPRPRPTPEGVFGTALAEATCSRDRLMLMLAGFMGLRCAEISRVHTRDLLGASLRIKGKGGVVRVIPCPIVILAELSGRPSGFLFPGNCQGHLAPNYVGKILKRLLGPGWSAHTLRHRFSSVAYSAERDLRAVQELLGHASLVTTQIYTEVPDQALRRAVDAAAIIKAS